MKNLRSAAIWAVFLCAGAPALSSDLAALISFLPDEASSEDPLESVLLVRLTQNPKDSGLSLFSFRAARLKWALNAISNYLQAHESVCFSSPSKIRAHHVDRSALSVVSEFLEGVSSGFRPGPSPALEVKGNDLLTKYFKVAAYLRVKRTRFGIYSGLFETEDLHLESAMKFVLDALRVLPFHQRLKAENLSRHSEEFKMGSLAGLCQVRLDPDFIPPIEALDIKLWMKKNGEKTSFDPGKAVVCPSEVNHEVFLHIPVKDASKIAKLQLGSYSMGNPELLNQNENGFEFRIRLAKGGHQTITLNSIKATDELGNSFVLNLDLSLFSVADNVFDEKAPELLIKQIGLESVDKKGQRTPIVLGDRLPVVQPDSRVKLRLPVQDDMSGLKRVSWVVTPTGEKGEKLLSGGGAENLEITVGVPLHSKNGRYSLQIEVSDLANHKAIETIELFEVTASDPDTTRPEVIEGSIAFLTKGSDGAWVSLPKDARVPMGSPTFVTFLVKDPLGLSGTISMMASSTSLESRLYPCQFEGNRAYCFFSTVAYEPTRYALQQIGLIDEVGNSDVRLFPDTSFSISSALPSGYQGGFELNPAPPFPYRGKTTPQVSDRVHAWLSDLLRDDYEPREKATEELIEAWELTETFVREALMQNRDPEVDWRLRRVIKQSTPGPAQ